MIFGKHINRYYLKYGVFLLLGLASLGMVDYLQLIIPNLYQMIVNGMHISPYEKGNLFNRDPVRPRRLLMHAAEIRKLEQKIKEKGFTLVPLQVYFKGSLVKVEVGLAKGKKLYDKRADIAKKDMKREAERDFKIRNFS